MVFKKKAISPFDEVRVEKSEDVQESIPNKDVNYFSLRAAVFMACLIISISGIFVAGSNVLLMSGLVAVYLLLWATTMRLWQSPRTAMVNLFVNLIVGVVVFAIPQIIGAKLAYAEFDSLLTVVAGVTILGSVNKDYTRRFSVVDIVDEFLFPILLAVVAVSLASLSLFVADNNSLGFMLILSSIALGGFSWILKILLKTTYSFSSYRIVDYNDFPVANKEKLVAFYKDRGRFAIRFTIAFVVSFICSKLIDKYLLDFDPYIKLLVPVVAALVFMIFGLIESRRLDSKMVPMYLIENIFAMFFVMFPIIANWIAAILIDLLLVGYMVTFKRRSIRAVKSIHVEGVPLILIVLGIVCLCAEALPL